jgi:hypothetical protein
MSVSQNGGSSGRAIAAGSSGVQSGGSSSGSRGSLTQVQKGLVLGLPLNANSMSRMWFRNLRAAISSFRACSSQRLASLIGRCSRLWLRACAIRVLRCRDALRLRGTGAAHAGPRGCGNRSAPAGAVRYVRPVGEVQMTVPTRRKTPQALESPPTQRHGQLVIPTGDNRHHKKADTGSVHPGQLVRKIEASELGY